MRLSKLFFLSAILNLICVPSLAAQTVTLTLGALTQPVRDTDEYFTDQHQHPKNFDTNCDVGTDSWYFPTETITNGVWEGRATTPEFAPVVYPLPPTFVDTLRHTIEDCYKFGDAHPVDASKYSHLSYSQRSSSPASLSFIYDTGTAYPSDGLNLFDGVFLANAGVSTAADTLNMVSRDLTQDGANVAWSGNITGIGIRASSGTQTNGVIGFDFLRIIDPDDSPTIPLSWVSNGEPSGAYVNLYFDDDNSGFDGRPLDRKLAADGNINTMSGILPPGTWYYYVELAQDLGTSESVLDRSAYVGPIVINAKPLIEFNAPGKLNLSNSNNQIEYFRDVVEDEQDFSQSTDVPNLLNNQGTESDESVRGFRDYSFEDGLFIATSSPPDAGFTVDTQVYMNVPSNKPINPQTFRYFCHRIQIDSSNMPRTGNAQALNDAAWVMRAVWVKTNGNGEGRSDDHFLHEKDPTFPSSENNYQRDGFLTYCIDLWGDDTLETIDGVLNTEWLDIGWVTVLRHDPVEAVPATKFALDHVWLTSDNFTDSNGNFVIEWEAIDAENDSLTIQLFYDSDNTGFNGTQITTLTGQAAGSGSYTWDASSVTPGEYYIYAIISDGSNTNRYYSDVHVRVRQTALQSTVKSRAPGDYDGDGKSDFTVVRGTPGQAATWYTFQSGTGTLNNVVLGDTNLDLFDEADTDGDRIADEFISRGKRDANVLFLGFRTHATDVQSQFWGLLGDVPFLVDVDGDHKDDFTVFRQSDATWFSILTNGGVINARQWGIPGRDIPVVGDFDGDGIDDTGVYRDEFGFWLSPLSSNGNRVLQTGAQSDMLFTQWGLAGDHIMPGDYTGDGIDDLVVWGDRIGIAFWMICRSEDNFQNCVPSCADLNCFSQLGLLTDTPVQGDYDGDGKLDYAIWRPADGNWYWINSSTGTVSVRQWGLTGDIPIGLGVRSRMSQLP